MKKIKNLFKRLLISVLAIASFTTAILGVVLLTEDNNAVYAADNNATGEKTEEGFVYLSDYDYVKELNGQKSYSTKDEAFSTASKFVGDKIILNGSALDDLISLSENGEVEQNFYPIAKKYFKGITACAPSVVIYDISASNYEYFSTYYGVEAAVAFAKFGFQEPVNSAICKFYFYTSVDGETWRC